MKCRITRDNLQVEPSAVNTLKPSLREQVIERKVLESGRDVVRHFWKYGAIVDLPDCFWLVRMGCAVPADEDCNAKANMTAAQMAAAQIAQDRLVARIEAEDFDLYDAGVILGYKPDAASDSPPDEKYLPGPNWAKFSEMRPGFYQGEEGDDDEG